MADDTRETTFNEFGWFDLSTSDPESARSFYSQLLGWKAEVVEDPQAGGYGFFRHEGKEVAGVGPLQNPQQPSVWTPYVLVEDADAVAAKAKELGGTVFVEPFDVMGQGIMGVIADPAGAAFGIWQPGAHRGAELKDALHSVVWVDCMSRNIDAAKRFYQDLLGWTAASFGAGSQGQYWTLEREGRGIAGIFPPMQGMPENVPSFWQIHIGVPDADATLERAKELGGTVTFGPDDIPDVGRIGGISDLQGVNFGILTPLPRQG